MFFSSLISELTYLKIVLKTELLYFKNKNYFWIQEKKSPRFSPRAIFDTILK